ncbi:MAG: flavoprotein [Spirochaetes bacterium]|nr:MAG: flavoprotein [Spirochaetota bacterium]
MSKSEVSKNVVLMTSGSIAAFKSASLASLTVKKGWEIQCLSSKGGRHFLGDTTLEGITGKPVLTDMFEPGNALDHIELADWADLMILYPASANRITRLRAGLSDDLIGALFLANNFRKPWWIAPAMNSNMFEHPAVTDALEVLESWGCRILPTGKGRLACGTVGYGRLLEPEDAFILMESELG